MMIGSLFSGIGGFELGLERAGFGPTLWQVEIDPIRRRVLENHWPNAKRFVDVREVGRSTLAPVGLICGGFPCQDVSDASRGRGGGISGAKSGLWSEFARIVGELRPAVALIENVAGAAVKKWLPTVRRDLHMLGYRTRALRINARDIGAPFTGARIFVVAETHAQGESASAINEEVASVPPFAGLGRHWRQPFAGPLRVVDGIPGGLDRVRMLGDSIVPDCAELVGRIIRAAREAMTK
jgi:DNA (cytosine-5)-methyltransferase 1